ncbi:MAG: DUF1559 domain-containing protein [Planctomycetota bacterium]|nr:MAG: DUF1559 domain-containing protein [Planctomycetota bacterium]
MRSSWGSSRSRAFTLIDVLVSMVVIGILIAILLPSINRVRESARRVVCGSNLRQVGLALHMYSEDSAGFMPPSEYLPATRYYRTGSSGGEGSPELMDTVRTTPGLFDPRPWGDWDGLGLLFVRDYLPAAPVFYCPSHPGGHPLERYEPIWRQESGEIVSNYVFRGTGPEGRRRLYQIQPGAAIVSDTLRSFADLNHSGGFNVLQAGLAVNWVDDVGSQIASILQRSQGGASAQVGQAWSRLDNDSNDDTGTDTGPTQD